MAPREEETTQRPPLHEKQVKASSLRGNPDADPTEKEHEQEQTYAQRLSLWVQAHVEDLPDAVEKEQDQTVRKVQQEQRARREDMGSSSGM